MLYNFAIMLKKLAVVVFFAISTLPIEAAPQPHKAQQAETASSPSAPISTIPKQDADSTGLQYKPQDHVDADIRVVSTPPKDRYDWIAFWGNMALTVVGIGGVAIGACTVWLIKRQADEMQQTRILMNEQLQEMRDARDLDMKILILQYRPKIIVRKVEISDLNLPELGKPMVGKIGLSIRNTGGTLANITSGAIRIITTDGVENFKFRDGEEVQIGPYILQPGQEVYVRKEMTTGDTVSAAWALFFEGHKTDPSKYIYLIGTIVYADELGIQRQTGITRYFDREKKKFVPSENRDEEYSD